MFPLVWLAAFEYLGHWGVSSSPSSVVEALYTYAWLAAAGVLFALAISSVFGADRSSCLLAGLSFCACVCLFVEPFMNNNVLGALLPERAAGCYGATL